LLLIRQQQSVLDLILTETESLKRTLGPRDRSKVDDYLASVREIERRAERLAASDLSQRTLPDAPTGIPDSFDEHINLMFDLLALSFETDMTRIATFMMAAEVSDMTYNHIGVRDAFHPLSHHRNNPATLERLARVQRYHTEVFARFVAKLAETPDGDGSMLDHSILLYGSNMSNSDAHSHDDLPSAIIGGGCGAIKGDQHLRYPDGTPVSNLILTVLQRAGVPVETHGDSTGVISEI
jgi:hypothetical protein